MMGNNWFGVIHSAAKQNMITLAVNLDAAARRKQARTVDVVD